MKKSDEKENKCNQRFFLCRDKKNMFVKIEEEIERLFE